MSDNEIQLKQDLSCAHYRPASKSTWYHAMKRAIARDDKSWLNVKCTTDVSKVTCPDCLNRIRQAITGR